MLRSSGSLLRHSSSRRWLVPSSSLHLFGKTALSVAQSRILLLRTNESVSISSGARMIGFRAMSSSQSKHDEPITTKGKNTSDKAAADDPTKEIVLTPGEKVVVASRLGLWAGIAAFASVCAYYIAKELIPTKMSPNQVFNRSFDAIRNDPEIQRRYGDSLKAYGRDHGGHREGRRNFIEHKEYVDDDGSQRTRIRYNMEGRFGEAFVFAEVSSDQPSGEFVYVLVQDKSNGRTHAVVDNRAALTAARLAGSNKEASSIMSQLLTGGSGKK